MSQRINSQPLKKKLGLLLAMLSEEDKFVRKFINLLERYNSELE
jgi:hypothetical protein